MKKAICGFLLFFTFVTVCFAQQNDSKTDEKNEGNVILKAGTEISATLKDTLDVEKTKNSDDFVLILNEDITGGGVKIDKGSEIMGRVVRANKISADEKTSEISIFFDFLKDGDDYLRFKADVVSAAAADAKSDKTSDDKKSDIKFFASPIFKGATVISIVGKNLRLEEGMILKLKLNQDLVKK